MNDLTGLDWNSTKPAATQKTTSANYYPTLRPTPPISGRSTPAFSPSSTVPNASVHSISRSNSGTPGNDSFANLVSFGYSQSTKNLSLQEQQKRLEVQRSGQQTSLNAQPSAGSRDQDGDFWEKLGSGTTTPNPLHVASPPRYTATSEYGGHKLSETINKPFARVNTASSTKKHEVIVNGEEDLLADFGGAAAKSWQGAKDQKPAPEPRSNSVSFSSLAYQKPLPIDDVVLDDDPFGLGTASVQKDLVPHTATQDPTSEEDDILGLLGRPVSEFSKQPPLKDETTQPPADISSHPQDSAVAELVDMGFSPERSKEALENTESGTDIQAAVGWLLNQAHEDSRKDHVSENRRKSARRMSAGRRRSSELRNGFSSGAPQLEERQDSRRQASRSPAAGDRDPAKMAAELGNNLFKTANSLWKTGTKKLNQAVAELNSDSDTSQPKWMKEAKPEVDAGRSRQSQRHGRSHSQGINDGASQERTQASNSSVTDEAMMLESRDTRPAKKPAIRPKPNVPPWSSDSSRDQPRAVKPGPQIAENRQPRFMQQPQASDSKTRLSRQAVDEQSSQAYISPARRKKATPKPPSPEPDLLSESSYVNSKAQRPAQPPKALHQPGQPAGATNRPLPKPSTPFRPPAPQRNVPSLSQSALQTSNSSRLQGSEAFKRGDYSLATSHYTSALAVLPSTHPLTLPNLTNRALSHSKTGDPKATIADATAALDLIGPSRGVSETIDLGTEGQKDMFLFWGKAMTRKAEALEQLERWADAAATWKSCVEAGVGGATSIAGRNRCDRAANPSKARSSPAPAKRPPSKPAVKQSALAALAGTATQASQSSEAEARWRAADADAKRIKDERFALSDAVSDRIKSWRAGKEGNLRALLASLETVLWPDAGWKKVGMGDLILPAKVKVVYMKGITKVHPDKIPTTASTEQRMISSYVFAILNEAWDGFKRENGL